MIAAAEVLRALYGAWRLARLDRDGMRLFDVSPAGALRSFWAAAVVLPVHLLSLAALMTLPAEMPMLRLAAALAISYVLLWTAFPAAMITICRLLGRAERFPAFLAAYNWCSALGYMAQVTVVLAAMAVAPDDLAMAVAQATMIPILAYQWYVTRTALAIGGLMAAGLVVIDLSLAELVMAATRDMLQG